MTRRLAIILAIVLAGVGLGAFLEVARFLSRFSRTYPEMFYDAAAVRLFEIMGLAPLCISVAGLLVLASLRAPRSLVVLGTTVLLCLLSLGLVVITHSQVRFMSDRQLDAGFTKPKLMVGHDPVLGVLTEPSFTYTIATVYVGFIVMVLWNSWKSRPA